MKFIITTLICILLVLVGVTAYHYYSNQDTISYGDNVKVNYKIAEGYENCSHIPRSVSLNKELKEDGRKC